jgi:pimeloyl-ACP methyl ester carboxylesterase
MIYFPSRGFQQNCRRRTRMKMHIERTGKGKAIVFIHGAGGSGLNWYFQKEFLKSSMNVFLLDLPGHGASEGGPCSSVEEYREACFTALQGSGVEKCFIVGHSMGGAIAMSFALTRPEFVEGLILIGTGAKLRVLPQILEGVRKDKEGTIRMIVDYAFSERVIPEVKQRGVAEMLRCEAEVIYNDFYSCDHFSAIDQLDRIEQPTLIICGEDDRLTPPAYSRYLHEKIRGSQLVLIGGAGHMVMLEKPKELNEAVDDFLQGQNVR